MKRIYAALCCSLIMFVLPGCSRGGNDSVVAIRRYVAAWPAGGSVLAATVTGSDSVKLVSALEALRAGGVQRADILSVSSKSGPGFLVSVELEFPDGSQLGLSLRAVVERNRVAAQPTAISTRLTTWEPLRIEQAGTPVRGNILSRSGTVLASGAQGVRSLARDALGPAVILIDQALDSRLAGRPERLLLAGIQAQVLAESPLVNGVDVVTSIDDRIQAAAEASLGRTPGALVAVDPRTGGIRALVSNPEPQAPNVSPATGAYSPGSAFKIVTATAALENGLTPDTPVGCPTALTEGERQITNYGGFGYGLITLQKAFAVSCNTAFAQVGVGLGAARLIHAAEQLGLKVGTLDHPGTVSVPRSVGELAVWSFGAAGSLVSPVEMAGIVSVIARGGTSIPVGWVDRKTAGSAVLSPNTAASLTAMMEEVVRTGTGAAVAIPGISVAGKTGTADARPPRSGSDAWFVGFAPSTSPRLVFSAFLPDAGLGGDVAAPLVRQFLVATGDFRP